MKYENAPSAIIRYPQPGATMFPEEKIRNEVATMRFIHNKTSIPVPFVLHQGTKKESPLELNPFIIIEYLDHNANIYNVLNSPDCPKADRGALDPNINKHKLEALYGELTNILLQLSTIPFSQIGSLNQIDDFTQDMAHRPLSMPINKLVRLGSLPQSKLPSTTFNKASSYFELLAELHISHLLNQRNDTINSANNYRHKFVARQLFLKLAQYYKLTENSSQYKDSPFSLWCDDLRPTNMLLNESLKVVRVIDWEFTYTAPVEFSHTPPQQLLIKKPEYQSEGLEDWCIQYERRLEIFLKAIIHHEDKQIKQGQLKQYQRLSIPMRDSWESGDFWISYAARINFAFDAIYWEKIDKRFFGAVEGHIDDVWKQRLNLLGDKELEEMENLVAAKLNNMESRVLAWDPDDYTLAVLESRTVSESQKEMSATEQKIGLLTTKLVKVKQSKINGEQVTRDSCPLMGNQINYVDVFDLVGLCSAVLEIF